LEELRDAIDDALSLTYEANKSKQMLDQDPDKAIKAARELLRRAARLVKKTAQEYEE